MGGESLGHLAYPREDFRQGHLPAFGEGVGGVAIGTAQIAGSQAHEDTGQTRPGALALHAQVNLIDDQRLGH
jgi:hypothetical protein